MEGKANTNIGGRFNKSPHLRTKPTGNWRKGENNSNYHSSAEKNTNHLIAKNDVENSLLDNDIYPPWWGNRTKEGYITDYNYVVDDLSIDNNKRNNNTNPRRSNANYKKKLSLHEKKKIIDYNRRYNTVSKSVGRVNNHRREEYDPTANMSGNPLNGLRV